MLHLAKLRRFALASLPLLATGCGITLEDGYKPRPLGASPEVRKSYYASPFSPEAEAGQQNSSPADANLRPGSR